MKRCLVVLFLSFFLCSPEARAWVTEALDWDAYCGQGETENPSIAVDASGTVHISSYNATLQALQYSTNGSGDWTSSILDSSVPVGEYSDIAVDDSGSYHIAYFHADTGELRYASNANATWVFEGIDAPVYTGAPPSIAVDAAGHAHVTCAYEDGAQKRIKYATNGSGSWVSTALDPSTDGVASSVALDGSGNAHILFAGDHSCAIWYVTNQSGGWETLSLDVTANSTSSARVAITADPWGGVHACWYNPDTGCLKYATNASGDWEGGPFACSDDSRRFGIGVDGYGTVHIAYVSDGQVWEARNAAGSWSFESIETDNGHPSLAVDPLNDTVHIAHPKWSSAGRKCLSHAESSGGAWTITCVPTVSDVGGETAMAADSSGNLRVLYDKMERLLDPFSGEPIARSSLGLARNNGGAWSTTVLVTYRFFREFDNRSIAVDASDSPHYVYSLSYLDAFVYLYELYLYPNTTIDAYGGRHNSVDADSTGHLHVSCYDNYFGGLQFATNASGQWQSEIIAEAGSYAGGCTSISVDPSDKVHIAYSAGSNGLNYVTNASGDWLNEVVDAGAYLGGYVGDSYASLALDDEAHAYISYYDVTNGDLKYATNAGGAWATEVVDTEGTVGLYTSIALGSSGTVHIAYLDETNRRLKYATKQGNGWRLETACDRFFGSGKGASLVVLDTGTVHISHSGYDGTLLFTSGTPCMDRDGDGYGDPANTECAHPEADCDDSRPEVHPGTVETCTNGIDDDCDGLADSLDPDCEVLPAWGAADQAAAAAYGGTPTRERPGEWNLLAALIVPMIVTAACLMLRRRRGQSPG